MITIFNRKELLLTLDMKRQADVRDILAANGIRYSVKVKNPILGSSRARVGSFGISPDVSYEYKIYVHKTDYDYASHLIK